MFERFTNSARHVVVLAQEEARLLSHNYIGTEHILLGLLGEPESVAGVVLSSFGITRDAARVEVEETIGRGKKQPSGHIPFTPRAKKVLELSLREALAIRHNYIGTEHILLGLLREGQGVAAQIMSRHANLPEIRTAVLDAVPAAGPLESAEGSEETNAVLRWLRTRLSRHGAGVEDTNSAASWALASLGVNADELREKLRSAKVTGTSDEQPEQAGRRQMSIQVSDETLTIVLTDPVIVEAGKEALREVHARAAAAAKSAGEGTAGEEAAGEESPGDKAGGTSATATVIRGDNPHAAGLANVWLELRKTLSTLADPAAGRRVRVAVKPPESAGPAEEGKPEQPGKPEAATS